jgi:L-threonylcarbamoyladenylate synthase
MTAAATRVVVVDRERPDPAVIRAAARLIREGWPVAFPTETVYGLGCDALSAAAIRRVFAAKGRPADNPLIVHLARAQDLERVAREVPGIARELARRFWPGALTLVLRGAPGLPAELTGGLDTIAVRVPDHPVAQALIQAAERPLAAPSANLSGGPSPTTAAHVLHDLDGRIPLILDGGETDIGIESTVLDVTGPEGVILRPGGISHERLEACVGRVAVRASAELARRSPGARYRHYQPRAEVVLVPPGQAPEPILERCRRDHRTAGAIRPGGRSVAEYARRLFAELRALDARGIDVIVVEGVEESGLGAAVMDRLRRAASRREPGAGPSDPSVGTDPP